LLLYFFCSYPPPTELSTLSLHDALPILAHDGDPRLRRRRAGAVVPRLHVSPQPLVRFGRTHRQHRRQDRTSPHGPRKSAAGPVRSEEHTSELQSRENLVCRLLLEKKKKK